MRPISVQSGCSSNARRADFFEWSRFHCSGAVFTVPEPVRFISFRSRLCRIWFTSPHLNTIFQTCRQHPFCSTLHSKNHVPNDERLCGFRLLAKGRENFPTSACISPDHYSDTLCGELPFFQDAYRNVYTFLRVQCRRGLSAYEKILLLAYFLSHGRCTVQK